MHQICVSIKNLKIVSKHSEIFIQIQLLSITSRNVFGRKPKQAEKKMNELGK